METYPLICIVGQTASGKTDIAIKLARQFSGEIICADSRTIYKDMNIGTAKPSYVIQQSVPHHLLDVIEPDQLYSVAEFKKTTNKLISTIKQKKKIPILAGGTGLYVDSVLYDFQFSKSGAKKDKINPRHLQKTDSQPMKKVFRNNTLVIGIEVPPDTLRRRIHHRIERMIEEGLEKEVKTLVRKYGWDAPGLNAICYKEWEPYLNGEQTFEQLKNQLFTNTWQYARRQKTWFKKNQNITWATSDIEVVRIARQFLVQ